MRRAGVEPGAMCTQPKRRGRANAPPKSQNQRRRQGADMPPPLCCGRGFGPSCCRPFAPRCGARKRQGAAKTQKYQPAQCRITACREAGGIENSAKGQSCAGMRSLPEPCVCNARGLPQGIDKVRSSQHDLMQRHAMPSDRRLVRYFPNRFVAQYGPGEPVAGRSSAVSPCML